jgi:hypothetical protein
MNELAKTLEQRHVPYECDICDCYHPWEFDCDCGDDRNRIADPDEYAKQLGVPDVEVRSMEDRVKTDEESEWNIE